MAAWGMEERRTRKEEEEEEDRDRDGEGISIVASPLPASGCIPLSPSPRAAPSWVQPRWVDREGTATATWEPTRRRAEKEGKKAGGENPAKSCHHLPPPSQTVRTRVKRFRFQLLPLS